MEDNIIQSRRLLERALQVQVGRDRLGEKLRAGLAGHFDSGEKQIQQNRAPDDDQALKLIKAAHRRPIFSMFQK